MLFRSRMANYQSSKKNLFETEIDLNSIFNLSYNFDKLKLILDTLIKNQRDQEKTIQDIKDNKLTTMEKKLNELTEGGEMEENTKKENQITNNNIIRNEDFNKYALYDDKDDELLRKYQNNDKNDEVINVIIVSLFFYNIEKNFPIRIRI